MNPQLLTVPVPGNAPVVLALPQPLTAEALACFERAIVDGLGELRRELRPASGDAGTIEYLSWTANLQPARS